MRRPRKALKWLASHNSALAKRALAYIELLEDSVKRAEAYAEKHANMYVEEQNQRAQESVKS